MSYRIAGVHVHKKMLAVVVSDVEVDGEYQLERRRFGGYPEQTEKEEKAVERARTSTVGKTSVSDLGQPAPAGFIGAAGPDESDHRGVKRSRRRFA